MSAFHELRFGGHLWRIEATSFGGVNRVSIWPFYATHDGVMKPGRGGLQFPIEDAEAVASAIKAAAAQLR
jgi:Transcriptional Coactivator p15 (PC4)